MCDEKASDYLTELTKNGPVKLEIYGHQVGGHSLLMKIGKAICKPLLPREHFFYTSIPQEIRDFTPAYHGALSVRFNQAEDGQIQLIAIPQVKEKKEEVEREGEEEEEEVGPLAMSQPIVRLDLLKASAGFSEGKEEIIVEDQNGGAFTNPWSAACMENVQSLLSHYKAQQLHQLHQDYLVLEDLTSKYECPCILDLKIGTRQYGDEQSEEKKRKHKARCASSTSLSLGVRICGMQIYDASKNQYKFRDKYYGRELDATGFYQALGEFLHNGICQRLDVIPTLVEMLRRLRRVIQQQDSYRFFSSSLLVIYDGRRVPDQCLSRHVLADSGEHGLGPSVDGLVQLGVEQRERRQNGLCHVAAANGLDRSEKEGAGISREERGVTREEREVTREEGEVTRENGSREFNLFAARKIVDIRMIDFAHTTHQGFVHDPVKYSGPDEGYTLGLDTLIAAFQKLHPHS